MQTHRLIRVLCPLFVLVAPLFSQTDQNNVPQPPTAELRKFDPFLGKYSVSGDFANLAWTGTLEWKKAIKGWYVQQIILIKSGPIGREFWILATWDANKKQYPLWGFQTLPHQIEGEVRFEADQLITEWSSTRPDGTKITSTN